MQKSIYCRRRLFLLAGVACIMLLSAAQFSGYSYAADEGPDEFKLDLGPQGKEKNRDLYGYGTASFDKHIGAGEWGSWELTYHVGRMGVDDGGRIFLLFHVTADWGLFQAGDPQGANYVSAKTTGRAQHIETAAPAQRRIPQGLDLIEICKISFDENLVGVGNPFGRLFSTVTIRTVLSNNERTSLTETLNSCGADSL